MWGMAVILETKIPFPSDDVFAWHERPGAMNRLLPPWQPVRALSQAQDLRDGSSELALPAGLRWHARHLSSEYIPGRVFVDELAPQGLGQAPLRPIHWRHEHHILPDGPQQCVLRDEVTTNMPQKLVRRMLAYRHRQLAEDLQVHQRAAQHGMTPLTVALTGSHGMVGTSLGALLESGGHRVIRLVRSAPQGPNERVWNPENPDESCLDGCDAVLHLAGASIAGRFNNEHRRKIRDSRIGPTRRLAQLAAQSGVAVFVSASAIGLYGADAGEEELAEDAPHGRDFLAEVVRDWEQAALAGPDTGMRRVQVRTGLVQSPTGGLLRQLRPLYEAGLGGRLGDGQQWQSWIGLDDLVDIYHRALWDGELQGPVNATAPTPVRNSEYSAVLAKVLRRPEIFPVPAFGPRLLLGDEGAQLLALASQRVVPAKLSARGHTFRSAELPDALAHCLGREH